MLMQSALRNAAMRRRRPLRTAIQRRAGRGGFPSMRLISLQIGTMARVLLISPVQTAENGQNRWRDEMKKIALAAAALVALTAGSAFADGSVALKGKVNLVCTIGVTDLNQSLNLTGGESNKSVGTMVENCNSGNGYTVSLSSANNGSLKSATGNATIAYTASYDGNNVSGSQTQIVRQGANFSKNTSLTVSIPANAQAIAGDYSDTLTITIAAK
jgi:spore coat protein U-like protein